MVIPLVIFSFGHWSGGAANILIAFTAGLILTGFYLWRRDLLANMIGHGLVDFVANVLPGIIFLTHDVMRQRYTQWQTHPGSLPLGCAEQRTPRVGSGLFTR